MGNLKKILLALCLCVSTAHAGIVTQTNIITDHTPGTARKPTESNLNFNKFDTSLGTLDSVQIIFTLNMFGGSVSLDNNSTTAQEVEAYIYMRGDLTANNVDLKNNSGKNTWTSLENEISEVFDLAEGQSGAFVGPTRAEANQESQDDYVGSAYLAGFQGSGTYTITAITQQDSGVTETSVDYSVVHQELYGDVTIIYHYTPIPEPATASLAGLGILILLHRRRQA